MPKKGILFFLFVTLLGLEGCMDEFEKLPKASEQDSQALSVRFNALVEEAKKTKAENALFLLHHFTTGSLSSVKVDEFISQAKAYIADAASNKFEKLKVRGARAPGRIRLLLLTIGKKKWTIPFAQSADGWKFDDVAVAFGNLEKEFNIHGSVPSYPPSPLASVAILQEPQASTREKVQAALKLSDKNNQEMTKQFASTETQPWIKTALLYSAWKTGSSCEPFAQAFPIEQADQKELYDGDFDSFMLLANGFLDCTIESKSPALIQKVYQACYQASEQSRSVYVDPIIKLANAKPATVLEAALFSKIKFEEDPVAVILVGGLHGESKAPFVQYLNTIAKQRTKKGKKGKLVQLAKFWLQKMADKDIEEPAPEGDSQ